MRVRSKTLRRAVVGCLLGIDTLAGGSSAFAADPRLDQCTKTFQAGPGRTTLSSKPSKLCTLDCFATGANAFVVAYDSPGSDTHGQAKVIAEKGAAAAGNSTDGAALNRYTDYGLSLVVGSTCYATGTYAD